jgi:tRNA pseudouridine38-40 synthase
MLIEYDGTDYHGWQTQLREVTIQRTIEQTIEKILQERVNLIGSGRTDAKVHALGQVANFRSGTRLEPPVLKKALNSLLPKDILIKRMEEVPWDFDSCLHALSKTYRYSILNRPERCAIGRFYSLHQAGPLNLESMEEAAGHLVGEHDFSSFRSSSCCPQNPIRRIKRAEFQREGELIHFFIEGNGFLHHMVRSIVGTLIEVGRGRLTPFDFRGILEARDRRLAGRTANPHGLCLLEVKYPEPGVA